MNIETERLIIKPLTLDDARRFSEYRDKEEVAMYQSWDEYPLNKAINRIEYCQKHPFHGQIGNYQFGLYLKENNQLIGDIFIEIDGHTSISASKKRRRWPTGSWPRCRRCKEENHNETHPHRRRGRAGALPRYYSDHSRRV